MQKSILNISFVIIFILIILISLCACNINKSKIIEHGSKTTSETLVENETMIEELTEDKAITLLHDVLDNDELYFTVTGYEEYSGKEAFCIKAFYDEGDHITTEGVYIVTKSSNEIYKQNMFGEGYIKIQ